jgi:hypothetical protein
MLDEDIDTEARLAGMFPSALAALAQGGYGRFVIANQIGGDMTRIINRQR